jgi:hypothetical protein
VSATDVISQTHLFHYAVARDSDFDAILREGLRPLSDFPESERWRQIEEHAPGFFERLYSLVAEPVLRVPYERSGIFLTPIDFRLLPGSLLHERARILIPVERIDAGSAVLTWDRDDGRVSLPFGPATLERARREWDAAAVESWFGRDKTRLFFHVPQVAAYQPRIDVSAADVEPPD